MSGIEQRFAKGQLIIEEGKKGDRTFFIKRGSVLICKTGGPKGYIPIEKLNPGEVFGEMYMLDNEYLRNATAVALDEVTVEVYFGDELTHNLTALSPLVRTIFKGLIQRLNKMTHYYVEYKVKESAGSSYHSGETEEMTLGGSTSSEPEENTEPDRFL